MITATVFALFAAVGQFTTGEVPEILEKAFRQREAFQTARFRYEAESAFPGVQARATNRYEAQISGDDISWTNFGDEDGVVQRDPVTGTPTFGVIHTCAYVQTIRNRDSGVQWSRVEGMGGIRRFRAMELSPVVTDPRSVGLRALDSRDQSPSQLLKQLAEAPAKWRVSTEGNIKVVTMACQAVSEDAPGYPELTWRIDPAKDNAVIESAVRVVNDGVGGELLGRCKIEYQQHDGHWWPRLVQSNAPLSGVTQEFRFHTAEFDRPDHPQRLTPDIWNLPRGVLVKSRFNPETGEDTFEQMRYLEDVIVVSNDEWESIGTEADNMALRAFWDHNAKNRWHEFPDWWGREEANFGLKDVETNPDAWEAYVRRWILQHSELKFLSKKVSYPDLTLEQLTAAKLKPEQITAAWSVLEDCRRRAEPVVRRIARQSENKHVSATTKSDEASPATSEPASVGRLEGVKETSDAPDTNSARPKKAFTDPVWDAPSETPIRKASIKSNASAQSASTDERELARIFMTLKKRLVGLLESEQRLPEDKTLTAPVP